MELEAESCGEVTSNTGNAPGVGTIPLDGHVEDHVSFDTKDLGQRGARYRSLGRGQQHQTIGVIDEAKLASGTQHAV